MRLRELIPGRRTPATAYLSLGSNVGDRDEHLRRAIHELDRDQHTAVTNVSGVYETEPVGGVEQDRYLNLVLEVTTTHRPSELLELAHAIESAHGRDRDRERRWGPRPLDIDIVLFADVERDDPELTIPHPRLRERAFVLVPLMEVHPGGRLPDGTSLASLVTALAPIEGIALAHRYQGVPGSGPARPAGPASPDAVMAEDWVPPRGVPPDISPPPTRDGER